MEKELGHPVDLSEIKVILLRHFSELTGMHIIEYNLLLKGSIYRKDSFTDRRKRPGHGRQTSTRIILGLIFSFYSDSGFCAVRPVRLDRSAKAFLH